MRECVAAFVVAGKRILLGKRSLGALFTYALMDGILTAPDKPPAPKRIRAIADLFVRAVSGFDEK